MRFSGVFLFVLFWLNLTQPNRFYRGQLGDNAPFFVFMGQLRGQPREQLLGSLGVTISALILPKFGKDVHVLANDMKSFRAVIETSVGSVFYSWIFGFGGSVAIKAPEDVKAEYAEMVRTAAEALSE